MSYTGFIKATYGIFGHNVCFMPIYYTLYTALQVKLNWELLAENGNVCEYRESDGFDVGIKIGIRFMGLAFIY